MLNEYGDMRPSYTSSH